MYYIVENNHAIINNYTERVIFTVGEFLIWCK